MFVAPQRWEGFGLTPLEAMATGVPVVATDVGAFPEIVTTGDNGAGVLIARDDLDAMAKAVSELMDDESRLARLAANAQTHVMENFRIEGEATKLKAIYDSLG